MSVEMGVFALAAIKRVEAERDALAARLAAAEQDNAAAMASLREFNHVEGEPLSEVAAVAASAYGFAKHRADTTEARLAAAETERDQAAERAEVAEKVRDDMRNRLIDRTKAAEDLRAERDEARQARDELAELWLKWLDELCSPGDGHDRHLRDDGGCSAGGRACSICDDLDTVRAALPVPARPEKDAT